MGVVTAAPGEAAPNGLEPGVGGDGEDQGLAEGVQDGPKPALAEPMGHGKPEGKNDGDLDPENRIPRKEGQKKEGAEKDPNLKELKEDKGAPATVESRVQVFRESAPQIPKVVVHAALNQGQGVAGMGAIVVPDVEAGGPHFSGQGNVLDQMAVDRRVPPDFFIGLAAKEQELAVGGAERGRSAPDPVRQVKKNEEMDEGDDEPLAPAFGLQVGPEGKEIRLFPDGQMHGMGEGVVGKAGIRIHKKEILALGCDRQLVAGPSLARPTGGQIFSRQKPDSGIG